MASGSADFNGKWKCYKDENFEAYLKATGMGLVLRKVAVKGKPEINITQEGDHFVIVTKNVGNTTTMDFNVGVEFQTDAPGFSSAKIKNTAKLDGDKLVIHSQFLDNSYKPTLATREIINGELVTTLESEGVVAKRWFKKE